MAADPAEMAILLGSLGLGLSYVNGANDVSKGIATLVGSGVTSYRRAISWGALWTGAGALLAVVFAQAMVTTFGSGLLADGAKPTFTAAVAMLAGATLWVFIATRTGLPVSTTHSIVGSVAGVAVVAYGVQGLQWSALSAKIVVPLLVSPVLSLAAVVLLLRISEGSRGSTDSKAADCLCVGVEPASLTPAPRTGVAALMADGQLSVTTATQSVCAAERPNALRVTLDHLHWLTSGATSFARGMNDAPKIAALVLAASALAGSEAQLPAPLLFGVVAGGMVVGSFVAGRKVTHVLAEKVTPMNHQEGFIANLVTASLVTAGATLGLPMSTTHVASGGIVGAGARRSSLDRRTLRDVALAWIVTLPASAFLGIAAYGVGKVIVE